MKIQKPIITQPSIESAVALEGAGANLTGSFSGAMDISSFDGNASTTISGSLGANATLIRSLTATTISGSITTTSASIAADIAGISTDFDDITNKPTLVSGSAQIAANISGSGNATSASSAVRHTTAEVFKASVDAAIGLSSDDVTILGNLTVQGTQTSLDTATLNVADLNITVASGSADSAAADGAGLTVGGAGATFTYTHSGTKWNVNKDLDLGSNNLITAGNVDGRDVSVDGTKLDTIEESATADQTLADLNLDTDDDVQFDSFGVGTAASGTTGEIRATGDITAYYSSDERLKENFAPLAGALDKVKAIGGYEFDWKDGIEDVVSKKGHDIGVKAQELQAQYPELVHERDNGYLAVDYIKLNAVLIEAVKELAAKVDELSK